VLDIGLGLDSAAQVGPVQAEVDSGLSVETGAESGEEGGGIHIGIDTETNIDVGGDGPLGGVIGEGPGTSGPTAPPIIAPPSMGETLAPDGVGVPAGDAAEITTPGFPFLGELADATDDAINSDAARLDEAAFVRGATPADADAGPILVGAAVVGTAEAPAPEGQAPAVGELDPLLEIFRLEGVRLPTDFGVPGPEQAGLVEEAAPFGLDALGEALEDFLAQLEAGAATLLNWLVQLGPVPWILMSLALLGALHQYLRTRRHRLDKTFLSAWLM
jgi:hypothetical protein